LTHCRLICNPEQRLGRNGASEIKAHPFFYGVNWDKIRSQPSPHVPQLRSITDTSYFPTEDLEAVPDAVDAMNHSKFLRIMENEERE
jgi:protein-serine/threonine kinase